MGRTIELTDGEASIFDALLDYAGDILANQGCNEFDMTEHGLEVHEMRALAREYHRQNGSLEEAEPFHLSDEQLPRALDDFQLLRVLQWRIRGGR